jgi:hypothetical protein
LTAKIRQDVKTGPECKKQDLDAKTGPEGKNKRGLRGLTTRITLHKVLVVDGVRGRAWGDSGNCDKLILETPPVWSKANRGCYGRISYVSSRKQDIYFYVQ